MKIRTAMPVTVRLYALALATIAVVVACERVPLTSPTGSTIALTVDQNTLPLNGQATVRAIVTESGGTPVHNGTQVNFSSSLGTFNPLSAETVGGVATTTFLAGQISGTTRINAYSGGASTGAGNSSGNGVEVKIGAAAAGSVAVSATPPSVSQSGGTVTISALVMDANNNPLPGASVLFSATTGTLSASTALSDSTGVAKVTLTTQSTATVTAFVGSARASVDVVVSAAPSVQIVDVSATPTAGQPVTFNVTVSTGGAGANSTPRQVQTLEVEFGDGQREVRTNVGGSVGFTHTYQTAGGYTITARATDVSGNTGIASRGIVVGFPAQPTVALSAAPNPVTAADQGRTTFTVNPTAASSGAPIRTVRVTLQDGTTIFTSSSAGSQQFSYQFGGAGTYTATATVTDAAGNTGSTSTVVTVRPW